MPKKCLTTLSTKNPDHTDHLWSPNYPKTTKAENVGYDAVQQEDCTPVSAPIPQK